MITVKQLMKYIDREAVYIINTMALTVLIIDARECYGQAQVLIAPVNGSGSNWVNLSSIALKELI
jgi:hypothetical protein